MAVKTVGKKAKPEVVEEAGSRKRRSHEWYRKFVDTYRDTAKEEGTSKDVAEAMDCTTNQVSVAAAFVRKNGVELPKLRSSRTSSIDWNDLKDN